MATRILGMGDIVSLVERAQEVFDEKEALEMQAKMAKAEFSYNDFLKMQSQMKMFGSMDQLLGMLPGMNISKNDRELISHKSEKEFKRIEVFIQSMTPEEREHPELMNTSRKKRIAQGSGIDLHTVNIYIKQFEQMRMMMRGMSGLKGMFSHAGQNGDNFNPHSKQGKHAMKKAMKMMRKFK
jgi:signal recognition particle subunit SRP54